jgi:hypothetical protein
MIVHCSIILVVNITKATEKQDIIKVSNTFSSVDLIVLIAYSFMLLNLKNLATSLAFSICSILVVRLITLNCVFIFFVLIKLLLRLVRWLLLPFTTKTPTISSQGVGVV